MNSVIKTYAAYYDNKIRMDSSSGGIFSAAAAKFDVIYGAAMTEDCYGAEFIRVEGDITPLLGSKYFQAKVGDIFKKVREDLLDGKNVLFSGTGCQINGLSLFLGKDYPNLFLLDIVCHGVPSPKLWKEYVSYQEKKYGKLKSVNFRCKDDNRKNYAINEGQLYISKDNDPFMQMFLQNHCLRPSCFECHAKHFKKSDMTIADFWGIERAAPEMNDGRGTSLVITRTNKGQKLFEEIKETLKWKEVSYEDAVADNSPEYKSAERPKTRDTFFEDLNSVPFEKLEKKYTADDKVSFKRKIKNRIKMIIKNLLGGTHLKQRSNADYGVLFTFKK